MKRFLALALILVLVLAMVPASSMAEEYAPQTPSSNPSNPPKPPKPVVKPPVKEELTAERYVPVPYVLNVADTEDGILASTTAHVGGESDSDGGELYTPDTWLMGLMLDKLGSIDADRREIAFTLNSAAVPSAVRGIAVYEGGEAGELAGSFKTVGDVEYFISALADISGGVIIRLS